MTVSFNLKPGVSLGQAVDKGQRAGGERASADTSRRASRATRRCSRRRMQNLTLLLIVAIGVVYIVLGVLYESYIHPITILSGLPSAGVGALLTLILFKVRTEYLLLRGPDHAGGHREEERHHADRFRAGSRAQARQNAARGDL